MKAVILAGGYGTRLSEETSVRPKPMVEIGGRPILWHIMKSYARYGIGEFVILGGYRIDVIRDYFLNYRQRTSDFSIDLADGAVRWHGAPSEAWRVTVVDTGVDTMTGGRIARARPFIGEDPFLLTYGDGVSDVDISRLIAFHKASGRQCTVTAVSPPGRFGVLGLSPQGDRVVSFREKNQDDVGLINGGFFVCNSGVFAEIDGDASVWELEPMQRLTQKGEMACFRHDGFWQSMDTLRDRAVLEAAYRDGAPWLRPLAPE
jgi:glucose-1-phosphate cytidylyltransferase